MRGAKCLQALGAERTQRWQISGGGGPANFRRCVVIFQRDGWHSRTGGSLLWLLSQAYQERQKDGRPAAAQLVASGEFLCFRAGLLLLKVCWVCLGRCSADPP